MEYNIEIIQPLIFGYISFFLVRKILQLYGITNKSYYYLGSLRRMSRRKNEIKMFNIFCLGVLGWKMIRRLKNYYNQHVYYLVFSNILIIITCKSRGNRGKLRLIKLLFEQSVNVWIIKPLTFFTWYAFTLWLSWHL